VCLENGVHVPHFCWHGALGSVGACRLCAVKVFAGPEDEAGRIEMACMTASEAGQRIATADPDVEEFRKRIIEWTMVNHPHDCAVCEEGGACQLQDMTVAAGHAARRYRFAKRTHRNQDLGPLLTHEMNRCIACYRCVRFYRDYAGGTDFNVFGAHDRVYFGRATDGVLESPFAGNLAEVCPTGVFNDKAWSKGYARKWDMRATPSICPHCSVGCNIFLGEREGRLRRTQNRYHGAVNGYFLCDRGRYGPHFVNGASRVEAPRIARAAVDDEAALQAARDAIAAGAVGLGSARASLEANVALRRLVGVDRFFVGATDAEAHLVTRMTEIIRAGPARIASLKDIETADAILVLGEDLTGTAPRAALAVRQAARGAADALAVEKGVPEWSDRMAQAAGEGRKTPIFLATPTTDALDDVAAMRLRLDPEGVAAFGFEVAQAIAEDDAPADARTVAAALHDDEAPLIIAGAGLGAPAIVEAAAAVASALGEKCRLALFPPDANSIGVSLLGDAGIEAAEKVFRDGDAKTLIILETDLFARAPSPIAQALLSAAETVIVLDHIETRTTAGADLVLPTASFAEAAGTFVNHEGRAQRFFAGISEGRRAAWRWLAALDPQTDWTSLDEVIEALVEERPALEAVRDAAPGADYADEIGGPIPRAPLRMSARTADDRAGSVENAAPPADPDSPLGWSMEGPRPQNRPSALLTGYAAPGFHSTNAVYAHQEWIGGPLRGGDPGAQLFAPLGGPATVSRAAPGRPTGDGLILIPLHDPFIGEEASAASPFLVERAPPRALILHPDDAAALDLAEGDKARIEDGEAIAVAFDVDFPRGHVGAPARAVPVFPHRRVRVERAA
ncbi:MAG: NADH-quinone oxidoreductase subunit NuoG, partial [Pseudomonadota bacterium]